jgi:hypothetical protein
MVATMAASDFTGTWKLNAAKSHGSDFVQGTLTITKTGPDTYTSVGDMVTKLGEKQHLDIVQFTGAQVDFEGAEAYKTLPDSYHVARPPRPLAPGTTHLLLKYPGGPHPTIVHKSGCGELGLADSMGMTRILYMVNCRTTSSYFGK